MDYFEKKKELTEFLKKLKDYKHLLINPEAYQLKDDEKPKKVNQWLQVYLPKKSDEQLKDELKDKLREWLVRKSAKLSTRITELVGTDEIVVHEYGQPRSVNVWHMGLRPEFDYRTSEALNACIDYTIQAIVKHEESFGKEITGRFLDKPDEKQEKEVKPPINKNEKTRYQKIWQWIESHKILSILGAIASIATIVGVIFAILNSLT